MAGLAEGITTIQSVVRDKIIPTMLDLLKT
jgi:hypothetical protein